MSPDSSAAVREAARRPALLSYVRQRQCVLFVGAGLSRPAGYQGWRGLMEIVIKEALGGQAADSSKHEFSTLLDAGRFAEIADQCREILGPSRFATLLRAELDKAVVPPEATHRPIVQTPYASIVTTNFDTLLEDAYGLWSDEGVPKCPTGAQLGRHGTLLLDRTFFILKAHGTIRDASSLVFTSEDYRRIIHANPAFQAMMAAILLSHAVVFVGYSLSDPNFRLLLDSQLSVFGAQAPPRYAVMEGVGSLEADILRRTAGIEAISYPRGEHECVAVFLSTLAEATQSKPLVRGSATALRERAPLPALRLAIRTRDAMLDVEYFETTTDDLDGVAVPLERRSMGSTQSLPWTELWETFPAALEFAGTFPVAKIKAVGGLLAQPFEHLNLPLVTDGQRRLVMLDIPHELAAIPWEWMATRHGPLCMKTPVCRTVPGFDDASRGRPFFHQPLRVLMVGDALAESTLYHHPLPGTREEAQEIARLFMAASKDNQVTVLVGADASFARVLGELTDGYDIVHLTGVASVDFEESVIPLHDGRVTASELATLLIRNPPGLLFVNEDCSGFVPSFGAEREANGEPGGAFGDFYHRLQQRRPGLERVVARAGVGTFIGCMSPSNEVLAREIAVGFYRHLLEGRPVGEALYLSRAAHADSDDGTPYLFAMAGYPDARITNGTRSAVERHRSKKDRHAPSTSKRSKRSRRGRVS
jgi:hypothetical protein